MKIRGMLYICARTACLAVVSVLLLLPVAPGSGAEPPAVPSEAKPSEGQPTEQKQPAAKMPAPRPSHPGEPTAKPGEPPKPETLSVAPAKTQESVAPKPAVSPILTIKLALMADPRLFPYDIAVDVNGSEALLAGKVASDEEKLAAAEVAVRAGRVKSVNNMLEVTKGLRGALMRKQDEVLTQYVKDRFAKSKTIESAGFEVKSENGIVSLSGTARFHVIVLEAAEAVRQVPGVKAVHTDAVRIGEGD